MKKRHLILLSAVLSSIGMWADSIAPADMAIRYYMPKTQVTLSVDVKETSFKPGKYAKWATKYLGVEQVRYEDTVMYEISDVSLHKSSIADTSRVYEVRPQSGAQMQLLTLTPEGLLYGYNVAYFSKRPKQKRKVQSKTEVEQPVAVLEETLKSDTLSLQAKSIAKQIYQLRDSRIFLLSGDVENAPADGAALKTILEEIDRQERALVQLFIGTEQSTIVHKEIALDPAMPMDSVILVVGEDSLRVQIEPEAHEERIAKEDVEAAKSKKSKEKKDKSDSAAAVASQIYRNQPGMAYVKVICGDEVVLEEMVQVAQLGVGIPLPQELFMDSKERVKIKFDVLTGNIISIRRN